MTPRAYGFRDQSTANQARQGLEAWTWATPDPAVGEVGKGWLVWYSGPSQHLGVLEERWKRQGGNDEG